MERPLSTAAAGPLHLVDVYRLQCSDNPLIPNILFFYHDLSTTTTTITTVTIVTVTIVIVTVVISVIYTW